MNDDPRDREVEDAYRDASKETPPPELDARILAAARRAVNARPQDAARTPGWLSRYRVPLSVAATAVIAVSVSLLIDDESRRGAEFDAPAKAQRADPAWGSRSAPAPAAVEERVPSDRDEAERARAQRNAAERVRAIESPGAVAAPAAPAPQQPAAASSDVQPAESSPKKMMLDTPSSANTAAAAARESAAATPSAPRRRRRRAVPARAPAPASPPPAAAAPLAAPGPAPRSAAQVPGVDSRERAASDRPSRLTRDEVAPPAGRLAKEEAARTPEAWLEDDPPPARRRPPHRRGRGARGLPARVSRLRPARGPAAPLTRVSPRRRATRRPARAAINPIRAARPFKSSSPPRRGTMMKVVAVAALAALLQGCAGLSVAHTYADVEVVNRATGEVMPLYRHNGRTYVAGTPGEKYAVRVANRSGGRTLNVVSVDGVNAVTGETAAPGQSGYVLAPGQRFEVNGWRKSMSEVAAFYFTRLPDSYAARTDRPENVGVIGVAVFREWQRPPEAAVVPKALCAVGARGERSLRRGRGRHGRSGRRSAPRREDRHGTRRT